MTGSTDNRPPEQLEALRAWETAVYRSYMELDRERIKVCGILMNADTLDKLLRSCRMEGLHYETIPDAGLMVDLTVVSQRPIYRHIITGLHVYSTYSIPKEEWCFMVEPAHQALLFPR